MKKTFVITTLSIAMITFVFVACFRHSAVPKEWRVLSLGMSRTEILSHISTEIFDQRYVKGFDMTRTQKCHRFGAAGCWMLVMTYDSSDRLNWAQIEFVCGEGPYLNVMWPAQLLYRINKSSIYCIH
jgi:hypothetical protein